MQHNGQDARSSAAIASNAIPSCCIPSPELSADMFIDTGLSSPAGHRPRRDALSGKAQAAPDFRVTTSIPNSACRSSAGNDPSILAPQLTSSIGGRDYKRLADIARPISSLQPNKAQRNKHEQKGADDAEAARRTARDRSSVAVVAGCVRIIADPVTVFILGFRGIEGKSVFVVRCAVVVIVGVGVVAHTVAVGIRCLGRIAGKT